jgi:hypothetical protein
MNSTPAASHIHEEVFWAETDTETETPRRRELQRISKKRPTLDTASEKGESTKLPTLDTLASAEMTDHDFAVYFQLKPFEAIHTLLLFVELNLVSPVEATRWLFPHLVKARGKLRERVYEALLDLREPETMLSSALQEYETYGNAERLALTASLLEACGAQTFPVLRVLARSSRPECDFFTSVIAHLDGVSIHERLAALTDLANNPHTDVRHSLLEVLHVFPSHEVIPLLQVLSHDKDENIAEEARDYLESLEA